MTIPWSTLAGWFHGLLLGALPWCAWRQPHWAPLLAAAAALVHPTVRRSRAAEPWSSALSAAAAAGFIVFAGGLRGPAAAWLALAAVVAATVRLLPRDGGGRPDAADLVALAGWGAAFAVVPGILDMNEGGWLAPAVMLLAARQLGVAAPGAHRGRRSPLGGPTREVRGTLSLCEVVATGGGLPATAAVDLDLRAGASLAVLCDDPTAAQALADVLAGRVPPHSGEVLVDGAPMRPADRLVAVVGPGEPFLASGLDDNLAALRDEPLDRAARGAARDACGLTEVETSLAGRSLAVDGSPLTVFDRLLVLTARVLVSHYRLLVVVDSAPWVDVRHSELWRAALVRASVGRTSVWITDDRELADRADHVFELVDGALRATP